MISQSDWRNYFLVETDLTWSTDTVFVLCVTETKTKADLFNVNKNLPFILRHKHAVVFCLSIFTARIVVLVEPVYYGLLSHLTYSKTFLVAQFHILLWSVICQISLFSYLLYMYKYYTHSDTCSDSHHFSTCFLKTFTKISYTIDTIHCFWTHKTVSSYVLSKVSFKMLSADNMNHNWSNANSSCTHE